MPRVPGAYGGNPNPSAGGAAPTVPAGTQPSQTAYGANEMAGLLASQVLPSWESSIEQGVAAQEGLTTAGQQFATQQQNLQAGYGFQQQQFGVQGQQLGLQRQALGEQSAYEKAQYGFEQQQNVLSGQNIQAAIGNILSGYGFQKQQFGVEQGQLNLGRQQAGQANNAAGVGATGTQAQTTKSFNMQQQGLSIAEAQAKQQEQYALFQQGQAKKELGLTEAQQKEQYGYTQQQLQNGMQQLSLQEKSLGISEAQANQQYHNALQQLGLSNVMTVDQLRGQLGVMAGGGYSAISGILGQLSQALPQLSGLFNQIKQDYTKASGK